MSTKDVLCKTWDENPKALLAVLLLGLVIGLFIMYLINNNEELRQASFPPVPKDARVNVIVTTIDEDGKYNSKILDEQGNEGIKFDRLPNNGQLTQLPVSIIRADYKGSWCTCWTQNGKTTCFPNPEHCF